MPSRLDKQLAKWLREQRGEMTFAAFSKKIGLPPSTIFRIENGEQSVTLGRLQFILDRLKATLADVFGDLDKLSSSGTRNGRWQQGH